MFRSIRAHIKRDGYIASWLDYTANFEYPECYAAFSLLVAASAAINGRITINAGYKPETMPNLYVVLYGPSGARKSEALLDAAIHLMAEAVPETPILPMNSTPEGLRHRLVADSRCEGVKNELRCQNDYHHGAARGLMLSEEFVSLVGGAEYQAGAARFLSKMWDTPRPFETFSTIAHGEEVIRNRYIVVGTCTTPKDFHMINFDALEGGLLRRLLIVQSFEPIKESPRPHINYPRLRELQKVFGDRLGHGAFADQAMSLSPAAAEVNERWYTTTLRRYRERARGEKAGKFVNSVQVHAFKIAAILELLEGGRPSVMQPESLRAAFGIVSDLLPGTFQAYEGMVPTALARLKTVVFESVAAARDGVSDLDIDVQVGAEMGVEGEAVSRARKALLAERKLLRGADGLLRLAARVYGDNLAGADDADSEPPAAEPVAPH